MFQRSEPYSPRPIRFLDVLEHDGWRLKVYAITYGPAALQRELYDEALRDAMSNLPRPAVSQNRPGVGFVICHQGRGWHYLVVSWWDNENELLQRVYVRPTDAPQGTRFHAASGGESACVWDLQVIWFERE